MKTKLTALFFLIFFVSVFAQTVTSPSGLLKLEFILDGNGTPVYTLYSGTDIIVKPSWMGIFVKNIPALTEGFEVVKTETKSVDESWEPVLGEYKSIRNNYNELAVTLKRNDAKKLFIVIRFRLFNDGLGFRYEFPNKGALTYFTVTGERTEFVMTGNHKVFYIPGDYDTNEYFYITAALSDVNSIKGNDISEISTKTVIADNAVQSPLMMKSDNGYYINIFEAALVDYTAMHLLVDRKSFVLTSALVPNAAGDNANLQTPCSTPWRTVIVSKKAEDILASKITLNLNEPSRIKDVSWIKPQKYIGIWWELHIGKSSWNYGDTSNIRLSEMNWNALKPNGKHGATTENTKRYIDFAAKHGFDGVLVEGWNVGWEDWYGHQKEEVFDFLTPYPDFDVDELSRYAKAKGVGLIMHHETSASVTNYERRLTKSIDFMNKYGYKAVKTGYVGRIIPRGEFHDGQWMVNHYVRVAEAFAENKILLDAHEPVRPTGLNRTYPNWLACEAARGNEFNAWSRGNPPEHESILAFTRLLGGPMDYTPGIFRIKMSEWDKNKTERVHTTLAKQLALYVTMYSPLHMAADLPEVYEQHPDAFQFIKDVAMDWDDTKILAAEPGDYVSIARKAKGKSNWYIGAITDENERIMEFDLSFLDPGKEYTAAIYSDADDAHWENNPTAYKIETRNVNSGTKLKIRLAAGGGVAMELKIKN